MLGRPGAHKTKSLSSRVAGTGLCAMLLPLLAIVLSAVGVNRSVTGVLLVASAVGVPVAFVAWLVLWLRTDRLDRIGTANLLFIWSLVFVAMLCGGRLAKFEQIEVLYAVGLVLLVLMAGIQHWLRRRWAAADADRRH